MGVALVGQVCCTVLRQVKQQFSHCFFFEEEKEKMTISMMNADLKVVDPEMQRLIDQEKWRQYSCLELIASEVNLLFQKLIHEEFYVCSCHASQWHTFNE